MVDPATRLNLLEQLEKLLSKGWEVPHQKRIGLAKSPTDKLKWLQKNLGIKNSKNIKYQAAMKLLDELLG